MNNFLKLWGLGLTLAVIVAMSKALTTSGFHPMHIALLQAASSSVILGFFGLPDIRAALKRHWRYFVIASLLGFTLPQLIVFSTAQHLGVGIASLTYALPLLVTWLLSLALGLETFKVRHLLVLTVVVLGTVLFLLQPNTLSDSQWVTSDNALWLAVLVLVPLSLGMANIYRVQFWPASLPILHVAFMTNVFSTVSYLILLPALGEQSFSSIQLSGSSFLNLNGLLLMAMIAVLGGANQLLLFSLHRTAAPVFISQIGSVTTLCGGLLGFLVYQETYTTQTLLASLLILAGVMTYSRMKTDKADLSASRQHTTAAPSNK